MAASTVDDIKTKESPPAAEDNAEGADVWANQQNTTNSQSRLSLRDIQQEEEKKTKKKGQQPPSNSGQTDVRTPDSVKTPFD